MNTAEERVAIYVVQYNGTWGWEPVTLHRTHGEASSSRKQMIGAASGYSKDALRVVRYMPEATR